jgi:hypothetical protein
MLDFWITASLADLFKALFSLGFNVFLSEREELVNFYD